MKKATRRKSVALNHIAIDMAGINSGLFRLNVDIKSLLRMLEQHHAQDVALYERSIACSEEIARCAGRQTLVAECTLNNHLNSRTTPTEG